MNLIESYIDRVRSIFPEPSGDTAWLMSPGTIERLTREGKTLESNGRMGTIKYSELVLRHQKQLEKEGYGLDHIPAITPDLPDKVLKSEKMKVVWQHNFVLMPKIVPDSIKEIHNIYGSIIITYKGGWKHTCPNYCLTDEQVNEIQQRVQQEKDRIALEQLTSR
jgi:hypothetical protein